MKKKYLIIGLVIILIIGGGLLLLLTKKHQTNYDSENNVVLSLEDKITDNSIWCGTFNLIWNDLKNDLAKRDIVFIPQLDEVINLNKGTFSINDLSNDSYYKVYGHPTLELKKEIEENIKKKFNEKSDILDDFNWNGSIDDYILYVMLKKVFTFPTPFEKLNNSYFKDVDNVKFFGINKKSNNKLREQVAVLYYDDDKYAVKLNTKENDEVILVKDNNGESFYDIYQNTIKKSQNYYKNNFTKNDTLRVPNITLNIKKDFDQLTDKPFSFANGDIYVIRKAIQTIKFELDNKGGKIKSEAGMQLEKSSISLENESRDFVFNDTFIIFLKEKGKELPYFAAKISDIKKFQ